MPSKGPKVPKLDGNTPKERFQSARALQKEIEQTIDAAKQTGTPFGGKARAAEKAAIDSVAFDAAVEYRKSRRKQ